MRAVCTVLITCIVLLVLFAERAGAEMAMLKPGYVACENLSSAEMLLKAAKAGNGFISGETLQDNRCVRTQDLAGLRMEVVERQKNHCRLLLRAEKTGQRNAEFWASEMAVRMLKGK